MLIAIFGFVEERNRESKYIYGLVLERDALNLVFNALLNAETGQRGYLLTGNPIYLEPYRYGITSVDSGLREIENLSSDKDGELDRLRELSREKLSELRETINLHDVNKREEALSLVNKNIGKHVMDQLREIVSRRLSRQDQQIDAQFQINERLGSYLRGGALGAVLILSLLALATVQQLRRRLDKIRATQDQLRQAQKMEAVGQLTGGLAHDFNNMLAVIVNNTSLAKRLLDRGETNVVRFLDGALDGAERAATLTRRLLAFSRQQPLSPAQVEPNKLVANMAELLRRTLGENIRLETVLAGGVWFIHVDPAQLESAILNLALNARDAMPNGGNLTIETSNAFLDEEYSSRHFGIRSGQYVLIAVTDTGVGMSNEVATRAFDPFFTTKPQGKGTGLGLSQVHGFILQSRGHVKIYSELGRGTTVKIYFPRHWGSADAQTITAISTEATPRGKNEIILVVEDEEHVRRITGEALSEIGYKVIQADGAGSALSQLDAQRVDLLFTDVVMPDKSGSELADEACKRWPGLKVLFTTGFTRNAVVHNGILDRGVDMIVKPYSISQLARKLREVLDRSSTN